MTAPSEPTAPAVASPEPPDVAPPSAARLARSAGVVGAATLTSRVLGLVRDQILAYLFGAGNAMDAFNVAYRVPNLMRDLFAEGAMSAAFVPTFTRRLAQRGCYIEYDFFGIETSYYWFADADLPTDYMRLAYIRALIEHGHGERIVISHDICTKTRLVTYGGHGYGHIVRNVVPLMRKKGFTEHEIDAILVRTPRRLLTFAG